MSSVHISLEFTGLDLPVVISPDGFEAVPVKPIVDALNLVWHNQFVRIKAPEMAARLGTHINLVFWNGKHLGMTCIRLDRIPSFILSINPNRVRAGGGEGLKAATFIEKKHKEMDRLLDRAIAVKRH